MTGDGTGLFALVLLFEETFFGGEGDGAFSSSEEDEEEGLTLIRFGRFFSRAAFVGDGERDEDDDDAARALPFGSTGFFFFSSPEDEEDDVDEDDGDRLFTGLAGLRRRAFDLS